MSYGQGSPWQGPYGSCQQTDVRRPCHLQGTRVSLTRNIWQEVGLYNGATGTIVDIRMHGGTSPLRPFLYVVFFCFISAQSCEEIIYLFRVFGGKIQKQRPFLVEEFIEISIICRVECSFLAIIFY